MVENREPLVTVVTPYYNNRDLYDSIQSVLEQDYPNIQYIIINDGSTAPTLEDVAHYLSNKNTSCKVHLVENKENLGTVKTMNRAYQCAEGEYIFHLAADDVYYDDKVIKNWVTHFQSTGALASTGYRELYDESLEKKLRLRPIPSDVELIQSGNTLQLFQRLCQKNIIFGCVTAYSKKCIEQYGSYDTTYRLIEDYPKVLSLSRAGVPFSFFDCKVVKCRTGGTSSGKNYSKAYEQDTELIFSKEILPYSTNLRRTNWNFFCWIFRQKVLKFVSNIRK